MVDKAAFGHVFTEHSVALRQDHSTNAPYPLHLSPMLYYVNNYQGARGGVVVKALRYKPAGRGFVSPWCHWNFSVS